MEFIYLTGSWRKCHRVGLFSTVFFLLSCVSPIKAERGGRPYIFTAIKPFKTFFILLLTSRLARRTNITDLYFYASPSPVPCDFFVNDNNK